MMGKFANIDALISSRICHDLISPVGAISNGIELMGALETSIPEIGLIADSVGNATAKLQFFRVCFGQYSAGSIMGSNEMQITASNMLQTARLKLKWRITSEQLPRKVVKLLFLMLLCTETTLPVGGTISITEDGGRFDILATGSRIQINDIWQIFEDLTPETITPAQVQFPQVLSLAADIGRQIHIEIIDNSLHIKL